MIRRCLYVCAWLWLGMGLGFADDGYRLWLNYDPIANIPLRQTYSQSARYIVAESNGVQTQTAARELQQGLQGLLGQTVEIIKTPTRTRSGGIILKLNPNDAETGREGYRIQRIGSNTIISAQTDVGVLYGAFGLLRKLQTQTPTAQWATVSRPKIRHRLLNHWDNANGTIERGYAGASLWKWAELPDVLDPRYRDYARANASIGINGTVLNNVNASARFLTPDYLRKVAALADVFRPYGIRVYLSVYFPAPKVIGGLATSDPLDANVQKWWIQKANEIYGLIPDFGGFLVKANSEGEPGPQDYGRTHADGANMLARAVRPHGGIVMWRSFVYKAADASDRPNGDRFKAAYDEFKPLDGQFDPNVIVQVKNGPIDFQIREPFSPLFGAMEKTPLAMEFQLTQEYLGQSTHTVFEAPMFKECLDTDTYRQGPGSTVAKVIDGSLYNDTLTVIAGVANTGSDRNWTGNPLAQANWYAFGRLAWDYTLSSAQLAREWTQMTLTTAPEAVGVLADMLVKSREIYVNYTNPLGLHHIMGYGHHYGPQPWLDKAPRPDWKHTYYHRADSIGIGFDRTASGSNALAQYAPAVQQQWGHAYTCPLPYLLWFHHVPWTQKLSTGRTLWAELCTRYYAGADSVAWMQRQWASVKPQLNPDLFAAVSQRLAVQHREAIWWRDACVLYFQTFSRQPIPPSLPKPTRTLEEVKKQVDIYQLR